MQTKKHWVLGTISGFFFGLFLAIVLLGFGVVQLDSAVLTILPIAGLLIGLGGSLWAPIPPRQPKEPATAAVAPGGPGFAPDTPDETPSEPPMT